MAGHEGARARVVDACCLDEVASQIVYTGAVLSDAQTLTSIGYSTGKSLVVTAPPASSSSSSSTSAPSSASAASINAAIDAAYDASLVADSARQDQ